MVTLEEAYRLALKCERTWEDGTHSVIDRACERPDGWGFTLISKEYPEWSMPVTFFISKEDGHKFYPPPGIPPETDDWWAQCKRIELPPRESLQ